MSNLSQFIGGGATTSIVNAFSSGGAIASGNGQGVAASTNNGAREILSGALTANALETLLTVSGAGRVPFLTVYTKDGTVRTLRLVVEVDGVSVFDAVSAVSPAFSGSGMVAAGARIASGVITDGEPIVFSSSLVVKVASSLTETDKVAIGYILHRN